MKKYEVIYADPPWDYGSPRYMSSKSVSDHYPTMKKQELIDYPVPALCDKNCLLFLWTSSPHLDQAIKLGEAWGFNYKTVAFVWDKQRVNPGFYTMSVVELCLVFKKGKIPSPRGIKNARQMLSEMRTEHSKKPIEIRNRIMAMFPTQNKIELFARNRTPGWDVIGNEVDKFES